MVRRSAFNRFEVEEHAQRTKGGTTYYYVLCEAKWRFTPVTVYLQTMRSFEP